MFSQLSLTSDLWFYIITGTQQHADLNPPIHAAFHIRVDIEGYSHHRCVAITASRIQTKVLPKYSEASRWEKEQKQTYYLSETPESEPLRVYCASAGICIAYSQHLQNATPRDMAAILVFAMDCAHVSTSPPPRFCQTIRIDPH